MPRWLTEIDWVTGLRSEPLTLFCTSFTHLGGMGFSLLFLGFGYFVWRRDLFGRLILVCLLSELINVHLKSAYRAPRPDAVYHLVSVTGWSFPSGHAQQATALWMWLALELNRTWAWLTGASLVLVVAASRVYLGVHVLREVVAGVLAGLLVLVYSHWLIRRGARRPSRRLALVALLSGFQALWILLSPQGSSGYSLLPGALFAGFAGGLAARRPFGLRTRQARRLSLGLTVPLAVFGLVAHVVPPDRWWGPFGLGTHPAAVFLQFALIGFWASWAVPRLRR